MNATPLEAFRSAALASGLVTDIELEDAQREAARVGPQDGILEVDQVAEILQIRGVLTGYQKDQLKAGRTKLKLGPYRILDWIGEGGMGQVFRAEHSVLGRECAIKVLPLSRATEDAKRHFLREIRTQANLDHPNLVRAYDAGEDGNVSYLVVEYVPGADLRRLVKNSKPLSMQQAASILSQAALGLQHAHERGLIHRDIKPGNILVTPEGVAKLSDLGLSQQLGELDEYARRGKIVGTADYLAPEQIKRKETTAASDIYSLGCTLYYAVTGKVPFPGGDANSKAVRHCEEVPWHPRKFNPDISEEFVEVVADMMEKEPRDRIQTASEVALRLKPWASDPSPLPTGRLSRPQWMTTATSPQSETDGILFEANEKTDPNASETGRSAGSLSSASAASSVALPPPPPMEQEPLPYSASQSFDEAFWPSALALAVVTFFAGGALGALATWLLMNFA